MTDELERNLRARAKVWAGNITKLANQNLGKFRKLILVQSRTEDQSGKIGIISTASNRESNQWGVKRVARAYEYGSGIHATRGMKKEYIIKPRPGKKLLAFEWDVLDQIMGLEGVEGVLSAMQYSGKFAGISDEVGESGNPKYLFRYVEHPGVEALNGGKGYLRISRDKVRRDMRKEIPAEVRKSVIGTFRTSFKKQ